MISYNLYWLSVICGFSAMRYNEKKGHWPLMKPGRCEDLVADEEQFRERSEITKLEPIGKKDGPASSRVNEVEVGPSLRPA